jgi:hypothetical protein
MSNTSEYSRFMRGLACDVRLGRFVRHLTDEPAEVVILKLAQRLADVDERNVAPGRPAHLLGAEVRG